MKNGFSRGMDLGNPGDFLPLEKCELHPKKWL
jgi:hypothetical protein